MSNTVDQSDKPTPGQPSGGDAANRSAQQPADGRANGAGQDYRQHQYDNTANGQPGWYSSEPAEPRNRHQRDGRDVFFGWIRRSDLVRTDDRYIGGVCAGIAHRLGWSPALVRAIAIVLAFCGGFGIYAYVFAWLLMPDSADGHIIAEDVLHGGDGWQWVFAPIAMLCVASVAMSWLMSERWRWDITAMVMLFAFALVLVMFNATSYRGRRQRPMAAPMPTPGAPMPGNPVRPQPVSRPAQPSPYPQYNGYGEMPSSRPIAPAQPRVVRARRKPAGPLVVLASFGLVLLSAALMVFWYMNRNHGEPQLVSMVASATGWIGCVCVALGALLVILGIRGRRTGGLHPLVWLSAFIAMVMMFTAGATGYCLADINRQAEHYERVDVNGSMTLSADKATLKQLTDGVYFVGDSYSDDKVTIDLSDYGKRYGTHKMTDIEHQYLSYCPTGTYRMVASNVQVQVKLPKYCTYAFETMGGFQRYSIGGEYLLYDSTFAQVGADAGVYFGYDASLNQEGHVANPPAKTKDSGKVKDNSADDDADTDDDDDDEDFEDFDDFDDSPTDIVTGPELRIKASTIQAKVSVAYGGNGKGYVRIYDDTTKKEATK
ncbi:phage shock protein C, PspC [Bifidobacterium thermophilum]|nr:phage shock protein C, PspC [Bifidobacterium thermophilum]